jgi:hypothetical protein
MNRIATVVIVLGLLGACALRGHATSFRLENSLATVMPGGTGPGATA